MRVFKRRTDWAMEAEGVEKGWKEQDKDHAKNDHNQEGGSFYVKALMGQKCCGGQEAESCRARVKTGMGSECWEGRLHGRQVGVFWHDGYVPSVGFGRFCCGLKQTKQQTNKQQKQNNLTSVKWIQVEFKSKISIQYAVISQPVEKTTFGNRNSYF